MPTITKQDLVHRLAQKSRLLPNEAEQVIHIILDEMKRAMAGRERIEIRGFGAFSPHERAARHGRNPRSHEAVSIPTKTVVSFKPSLALTSVVNGDIDAADQT